MSRNAPLSCQTSKHFVVIRKNREYPVKLITDWLNENYSHWAFIVHKNHKEPITGEIIPTHYHYVGKCKRKDVRLKTILGELAKLLKTDTDGIEIDKYNNLDLSIQYLIHKNNPEKTQEKVDKIVFGGWTKDDIINSISADSTGINIDRLLSICKTEQDFPSLLKALGLNNYHKYRNVILDILKYYAGKPII